MHSCRPPWKTAAVLLNRGVSVAALISCQVGVGIHGDALKMQRDWGLEPHGVVDLSETAQDRGVFNGEPGAKWSLAGKHGLHVWNNLSY